MKKKESATVRAVHIRAYLMQFGQHYQEVLDKLKEELPDLVSQAKRENAQDQILAILKPLAIEAGPHAHQLCQAKLELGLVVKS